MSNRDSRQSRVPADWWMDTSHTFFQETIGTPPPMFPSHLPDTPQITHGQKRTATAQQRNRLRTFNLPATTTPHCTQRTLGNKNSFPCLRESGETASESTLGDTRRLCNSYIHPPNRVKPNHPSRTILFCTYANTNVSQYRFFAQPRMKIRYLFGRMERVY